MSQIPLVLTILLLVSVSPMAAAQAPPKTATDACDAAPKPDVPTWRQSFTENKKLPPVFLQGAARRPDGSTLTFFLGKFDGFSTKPGNPASSNPASGNPVSGTSPSTNPPSANPAGAPQKPERTATAPQKTEQTLLLTADPSKPSADKPKPLLIYIEGSGAQSQFMKVGDKIGFGVFGLIARHAGDKYHVATCEKRGVEFGDSAQRGAGEGASAEYTTHATLADRVADVRLLLDSLLSEPLIDSTRVILLGHSEGSDVAAAVAAEDPRVTHVAFLSCGGAAQLYDFYVMRRKEMTAAGASPEDIEKSIESLEDDIGKVLADPDSETKFWLGHAYKRWSTFATASAAEHLLKSKARLFLAHGSADQAVPIESFDFLVVELLRHGRKDVTVRRYPGRDHSFIAKGAEPSSQPFLDVIDEVLKWADPPASP